MNRQRGLRAGIFLLLILSGCSKDKTLNVEGAYTPVIVNLTSDHEPPVRGAVNALTVGVSNPRGYPIQYHWSTSAGVLTDSTSVTAHWTPPDTIGVYAVTVAIVAHDDLNNVDFFKTRTFQLRVDNEFVRWTRNIEVQFDVVPPTAGKIYYSQIRNAGTFESDVWALAAPLGSPEQITRDFWQATAPTTQSDGSRVAFLGKMHSSDIRPSIWQVPGTGGDTTTATPLARPNVSVVAIGTPRFAPTGSIVAYPSDTVGVNSTRPKLWSRDAANMSVAPIPMMPTTVMGGSTEAFSFSYWNPSWRGTGDSIVAESYTGSLSNQARRGLFKFAAIGNPPVNPPDNPELFQVWLDDPGALEPDWSPDGNHIVFAKRLPGRADRDLFIINAASNDPSTARAVTSGPADEFHPRFSSDGSAIFFMSNRIDGYGANGFFDTERRGVNIWAVSRFDRP